MSMIASENLVLSIDTSSNKEVVVSLKLGEKTTFKREEVGNKKSQVILVLIDKLLKDSGFSIKDISGIEVFEGPGSFTGLRVGISVANSLAYSLGIPINGKKIGEFVVPKYE